MFTEAVFSDDGKVVGHIEYDGQNGRMTLRKTGLDKAAHQLQRPPAWSTDTAHLDRLRELAGTVECPADVVLVEATGKTWHAPLRAFDEHGIHVTRQHGDQTGLALKYWSKAPAEQAALL